MDKIIVTHPIKDYLLDKRHTYSIVLYGFFLINIIMFYFKIIHIL